MVAYNSSKLYNHVLNYIFERGGKLAKKYDRLWEGRV